MNIVFVCTGNTCRSPMAEGFMKKLFVQNGVSGKISSRGLSVPGSDSVSSNSVIAASEYGVDISSHVPCQLSVDDIVHADFVFTLTMSHKNIIASVCKGCTDKIHSMSEYGDDGDVADPYGGDVELYRDCARQIYRKTEIIFKELVDKFGNNI